MDQLQVQIDGTKAQLTDKNQRVIRLSTDVDLAEESIRDLNKTAKKLTNQAENISQKANQIRRSDIQVKTAIISFFYFQGAYDLVKENADKSNDHQRVIIQEIAIISASETDRNKAEQLLNEHQKDFDVHYQENENKLKDIRETVIFCI